MLGALFSGVLGGYGLALSLLALGRSPMVALLALCLGGAVLTLAAAILSQPATRIRS